MYRRGVLDEARLVRYVTSLAGLTAAQIHYLRKYINSHYKEFVDQANDLGIAPSTLKSGLYQIRDLVGERFDWFHSYGDFRRHKSLRALDFDYGYLRMLGDPTSDLITPVRSPLKN